MIFLQREWGAGDEHDLLRLLAAGHVYGDSPPRPQDDAAGFPLHVLGRCPDGDDVPKAICECGQAPMTRSVPFVVLLGFTWKVNCYRPLMITNEYVLRRI